MTYLVLLEVLDVGGVFEGLDPVLHGCGLALVFKLISDCLAAVFISHFVWEGVGLGFYSCGDFFFGRFCLLRGEFFDHDLHAELLGEVCPGHTLEREEVFKVLTLSGYLLFDFTHFGIDFFLGD